MINMYYMLLPLTLFVALVASQPQACEDAQNALAASEECSAANLQVGLFFQGFDVNVTRDELNTYCSETCRNLNLQIIMNCITDQDELDVQVKRSRASINLVCAINGDKNCIEFLISPQVVSLNTALASGQCPFLDNNETCLDDCAVVIENFITGGECCTVQLLEFENNHDDFNVTYDQLLSYCDLDRSGYSACEVIFTTTSGSGAEVLIQKNFVYGGFLLIVAFAVTHF